ncbi:MAG: xanthine dehydrogenase small subunit [Gammaproteobacteria bacterium]|nr:xanthine dehydrogenase small subunit [Gammaproteobacteria bacterium]
MKEESIVSQFKPVFFYKKNQWINLPDIASDATLLNVLRLQLHCTDVKEGCASGDCGACVVAVADTVDNPQFRAINSCLRFAHSVSGMAIYTAGDLAEMAGGHLHPVQQAMVDQHATQCGFCTPGFVMSLFSLYQNTRGVEQTPEQVKHAISGNLCRCTGYRPIVDAGCTMHLYPKVFASSIPSLPLLEDSAWQEGGYFQPRELTELLSLKAKHPQATLVAGATDVGLVVTQRYQKLPEIIDLTRTQALLAIESSPYVLNLGGAVIVQDAFDAMCQTRPALKAYFERFAGGSIRQSATLAGNIANGSPIGDSMPVLLALDAQLVLTKWHDQRVVRRTVGLHEFYLGYRQTVLDPTEIIEQILIPGTVEGEWCRAYKLSKRQEDDISIVAMAIALCIKGGILESVRIGIGGVAATPVRAYATERTLLQGGWCEQTITLAEQVLQEEFQPLSDLRGSAKYRKLALGNLLRRSWLQYSGQMATFADISQRP